LTDFLHHVAMQAKSEGRRYQGDATANEQPARVDHARLLVLEFVLKIIGGYWMLPSQPEKLRRGI